VVEDGTNAFEEPAIQGLRYGVMLRGVMGGESSFSTLSLEEICEVAAGVLSTAVGSKTFDGRPKLSLGPCSERLVRL
jgi:hypothetical protein